jgi:hypothetical protein
MMSLELLDAHEIDEGISITFATEQGLQSLSGRREQVARLAEVMAQVAALAPLNETERVWVEDVVVGDHVVKLGLNPHGRTRMRIDRARW